MGDDRFLLSRFIEAQESTYHLALQEISAGLKRRHWMWYIFPQFEGLGISETSRFYSIKSLEEARAYATHPVLGPRLVRCFEAALRHRDKSARQIFGSVDSLKLLSCATLFSQVMPPGSAPHRAVEQFFEGEPDAETLRLLRKG